MFVNTSEVQDITGIEVTRDNITLAQHVIEAYCGRNESEVHGADDFALMARATAYQAVYMKDNYDRVFQQAAVKQTARADSQMTYDSDMAAPFIAPLAFLTLRNLSWKRSRSIKTGAMYGVPGRGRWETE